MERSRHSACCLVAAAVLLLGLPAVGGAQRVEADAAAGGWRAELVDGLLEPWARHVRDSAGGGFRTHLDRQWRADGPPEQYPSLLGRHLFSYSAGYLVTGDGRWLARADSVYRYLDRHAWDRRHGGWFDRLTRSGAPADRSKSTFVQVYAATGLALYHFVTRRPDVLRRVRRTNRILETRFRDDEHGGYFQQLARDFTVVDSAKTAASQLAPVSGHLLYLYAGTRDTAYLRQAERLTGRVLRRMRDPTAGWIRERFTAGWTPAPGSEPERFNVGHNLEVAWLLARLHLATDGRSPGPRTSYRDEALELGRRVAGGGYLRRSGAWIHDLTRPEAGAATTPPDSGRVLWWIQAYGNMTELTLARIRRGAAGAAPGPGSREVEPGPDLRRYRRGVAFWRRHLLDDRHGASLTAVGPEGGLRDGGKGGRWKTSYHAVEHALWNLLGEALWLPGERGVTLHFRPASSPDAPGASRRICPRPVPDPSVVIRSVRRGGRELEVAPHAACFRVRPGGPPVRVELEGRGGGEGQPGR